MNQKHPECGENEVCLGNWTLREFEYQINVSSKRLGKIPCNEEGQPLDPAPEGFFPVFIAKKDFDFLMQVVGARISQIEKITKT